ncbi:hypothetical protein GCM10023083_01560 [Streptomyces phyllanthi]
MPHDALDEVATPQQLPRTPRSGPRDPVQRTADRRAAPHTGAVMIDACPILQCDFPIYALGDLLAAKGVPM